MITIAPLTTKEDLQTCNALSNIDMHFNNDYFFGAKAGNSLTGFIKIRAINKQAMHIERLIYNDASTGKQLLIEALKCAWELGYAIALTNLNDTVLELVGFKYLSEFDTSITNENKELQAYELSYNGIQSYVCSHPIYEIS